MREHQIVITVKPEQFLQIQKLARTTGARSMGIFVRQQLLAALGIEGSIDSSENKMESAQLQTINEELKRLHSELKDFANESFSVHGLDPAVELDKVPIPTVSGKISAPEQDFEAAPVHELENLADQTFAISPRLGAFDSAGDSSPSLLRDPLSDLLGPEESNEDLLEAVDPELAYEELLKLQEMKSAVNKQIQAAESEQIKTTANKQIHAAENEHVKTTAQKQTQPAENKQTDEFVPPALQERKRQLALAKEKEEKEEEQQSKNGSQTATTDDDQNTPPLDSTPKEIPFSGGPPPKRRRE